MSRSDSSSRTLSQAKRNYHRCSSVCFTANWDQRHRAAPRDGAAHDAAKDTTIFQSGALHDFFIRDGDGEDASGSMTFQERQQQREMETALRRNSSIMCRRRNMHHLPCNSSWPMRVCCRLAAFRVRGRAPSAYPVSRSRRRQTQHTPQTHALRWRCNVKIGLETIPNSVFGEEATVSCFRGAQQQQQLQQQQAPELLSLPDLSHVRVRRADATTAELSDEEVAGGAAWLDFARRLVSSEEQLERTVGDAQQHLLVVRDDAVTPADDDEHFDSSAHADDDSEEHGENGACYRWIPRGERCHVTISLRNHDRRQILVSLAILVLTLVVVMSALCCRRGARQRGRQAAVRALDDMEQVALQKAFEREQAQHKSSNNSSKTIARASASAASSPSSEPAKVPANAFQIDEIIEGGRSVWG